MTEFTREEREKIWEESDAPYKAKCEMGLCISYYNPINCDRCEVKTND